MSDLEYFYFDHLKGVDESPGAGFLRCCNCKEWFANRNALARHTQRLIQERSKLKRN